MRGIGDFLADNPMAVVIAAGEVGFWVFILGGLIARYVLRLRRLGLVLLAATPVIDIAVLVATMIDLSRGGVATAVHGIAAVYLGFSVAFGPRMIRWADRAFAYRFAGGPRPPRAPKHGPAKLRYEWREWWRCVAGAAIAALVLLILIFVVGTPEQTRALWTATGWLPRLGWIVGIWFIAGPAWAMLSPRLADPSPESSQHSENYYEERS